jgi:hypothetical protein
MAGVRLMEEYPFGPKRNSTTPDAAPVTGR